MQNYYRAFLKNHNIQYLLIGQFISLIGERILTLLFFSIAVGIIGKDTSLLATLLIAVQFAPLFLFGYIFGIIADKYNKKLLLIICDFLRALLILGLLLYHSSLIFLYCIVFMVGVFYALFEPTRKAIIPSIVKQKYIIPFNRILAVSEIMGMIIGLGIGIFALNLISTEVALFITIVTYLVSMIMIILIRYSTHSKLPTNNLDKETQKVKNGFLEGLSYLKSNINARIIITNLSLISFFSAGLYYAALSDYSIRETTSSFDPGSQLGIFLVIIATGALVSPLLKKFIEHFKDSIIIRSVYFIGGLALIICSLLMILYSVPYIFVLFIMFITGVAVGTNYLRVLYLFHLNVEKKFLGRVLSINEITISLSVVIGIIAGSFFNEFFTYTYGFLLAGSIYLSGFFILQYNSKNITW